MEAMERGEPCGGREEGQEAGSPSEKEAPRKVQSHTGDRMEKVDVTTGGEEWGGREGRQRGHADRGEGRGRAPRWEWLLAGLGGGQGESGEENGVRPARGHRPGQPPAPTARHTAGCPTLRCHGNGK